MSARWTQAEQEPITPEQERYIAGIRMLAMRLIDPDCPMNPKPSWNEAIDIAAWLAPTPEPEWHSHD